MKKGPRTKRFILDSWAVLAWLQGEPSGEIVGSLIGWVEGDEEAKEKTKRLLREEVEKIELFINVINLGEVFYIIGRRRGEKEARSTIDELRATGIEVLPATEALVFEAAALKIKHAMAYADAFAVATAKARDGTLVTGDPELKGLEEVPMLWLGGNISG